MADTFPQGNDAVRSKGPCPNPKCDTEFGFVTYEDGHGYCFACGTRSPGRDGLIRTDSVKDMPQPPHHQEAPAVGGKLMGNPGNIQTMASNRRIASLTLKRFGYFGARFQGQNVDVAPYHDMAGNVVIQKLRLPSKDFVQLKAPGAPAIGECQLFGRQVWGDKNNLRVVITEGEIDAMSVAQACDFEWPCVSLGAGAKGAKKCLQANYLWLDRFKHIVLWFDDDEPGRQALAECAPLFKVGKVYAARMPNV